MADAPKIDLRTTAIRLTFWGLFAVTCAIVGAGIVLVFVNARPPLPAPTKPFAKINGPTKVKVGDLVEYTSTGSLADDYLFNVPDDNWVKWPDGSKVVGNFRRPGKYEIDLSAIAMVSGRAKADVASLPVEAFDDGPDPPPGPSPVPVPVPDGAHGLSKAAYLAAQQIPAAQRAREASLLAAVFESVASQVAAGAFTINELSVKTKAATDAALGASAAIWSNAFAAVDAMVAQLDQSKTLIEPADFAAAWREIAAGLRAVV